MHRTQVGVLALVIAAALSFSAAVTPTSAQSRTNSPSRLIGQKVKVHLLEVGDGRMPGAAADLKPRVSEQGVELAVGGLTFFFSGKAPYPVSSR